VLVFGGIALAGQPDGQDVAPNLWIALEGGWAHAFLDSPYQSGAYIGPAIPFRLDVGIRLAEHVWVAPFASVAWVKGESNGLGEPAKDGFRLLLGGEIQFHSAQAREGFDIFGGVGVAFERLVAHSRFESCGHCDPDEYALIASGLNLGIRIGILVHVAKFLQIGPYIGLQASWMPGLKEQVFTYPISGFSPGGSFEQDVKDLFPWVEAGLRVVFLP